MGFLYKTWGESWTRGGRDTWGGSWGATPTPATPGGGKGLGFVPESIRAPTNKIRLCIEDEEILLLAPSTPWG